MAKAEAKPASSKGKAPAEPAKKAPPPDEVADLEEDLDQDDEDDLEDETDLEEEEGEDDDEEEDEEEDEEVAPAKPAAKKPPVVRAPVAAAAHGAEADPNWWLPHAVLGVIVLIGVFGFFGFFNSLVGPLYRKTMPAPSASVSAPAAAAVPPTATPTAKPSTARTVVRPGATAAADVDPTFGAKRIVVRYKGAKNSKQERSKDDAKKRAEEALKKITGGAKFEDVAKEFSDEESAKTTGGNLGNFKRGTYDPAIIQTVEKLEVGKTSGVFESGEGFEIVTRTK